MATWLSISWNNPSEKRNEDARETGLFQKHYSWAGEKGWAPVCLKYTEDGKAVNEDEHDNRCGKDSEEGNALRAYSGISWYQEATSWV